MSHGVPRRLDHIQGSRGILMLTIVAFHCDLPPSGGFVALDAFFVISGYVITGLLLRELDTTGGIRFREFYLRRIRRLLPALALVLVVTAVLSALFESPLTGQRTTGRVGVFAAVSLANFALYTTDAGYFAQSAGTVMLRHTWSLSVEEQFYLVLPLFVLVVLARGRRRLRSLVVGLGVVSALSFASLVVMAHAQHLPLIARPSSAAYYFPTTRVWEMAAGALVAIWHVSRPQLAPRIALAVGFVGAVLTVGSVVLFTSDEQSSSPALIVPVAGAVMVFVACRTPGALATALSWRPLVWVGDRSYGWYLWHWPLIVIAKDEWPDNRPALVGAALVGLGLTTVSYRYVEQRFRYPRRDAPRRQQVRSGVRLAVVCFSVPIVAMALLGLLARHDWDSSRVRALDAQLSALPPGSRDSGCAIGAALRSGSIASCTVGSGSNAPIYLLGDSNAGQYADGLILAGQQLSRPVVLLWRPGCPFVDVSIHRRAYSTVACDTYNAQVERWLFAHRSGSVVVASANEFIQGSAVTFRDPTDSVRANTPTDKARLWTAGLVRSLRDLRSTGHQVEMIGMLPHPGGSDDEGKARWDPLTCGLLTMLRNPDDCGITVSLRSEDDRQALALSAEHAAATTTNTRYVDLRDRICPDGTCATVRDGRWIYRNGEHISVGESRSLATMLAGTLLSSHA